MSSCPDSTAEESASPRVRCDDSSAWRHKGEKIDLPRLLQLIEENGGPEGLDLRGCNMRGIDASSESVATRLGDTECEGRPPWYSPDTLGINLRGANLEEADLSKGYIWRGDFRGTILRRAKLAGTDLGVANFDDADLCGADLEDTELIRATFHRTNLSGVRLAGANCEALNLVEAATLHGAYFAFSKLAKVLLKREQIAGGVGEERERRWGPAKESYLALKANFGSIGRYDDASWAYVKERQMEKMAYYSEWRSHVWQLWRAWGCFLRWLRNWAYELLAGYGEWIHMPIIWGAAVSILVFPLLYWATGALPGHGRAFTSAGPSDIDWAGWGDSITFSLTSFGTLAFNRLQPDGAFPNILAAFEGFTGVLIFALFVFTLGNRMRRS